MILTHVNKTEENRSTFPQDVLGKKVKRTPYTIYTDASASRKNRQARIGIVIKKGNEVIYTHSEAFIVQKQGDTVHAELYAIRTALLIAKIMKIKRVNLYSDNRGSVSLLNQKKCNGTHDDILNRIFYLTNIINVAFVWTPRENNTLADELTRKQRIVPASC